MHRFTVYAVYDDDQEPPQPFVTTVSAEDEADAERAAQDAADEANAEPVRLTSFPPMSHLQKEHPMPAKRKKRDEITLEALATVIGHPDRFAAIDAICDADGPRSTKQLVIARVGDNPQAIKRALPGLAYHVKQLALVGVIELDHTTPRRGAIEKFYTPVDGIADVVAAVKGAVRA